MLQVHDNNNSENYGIFLVGCFVITINYCLSWMPFCQGRDQSQIVSVAAATGKRVESAGSAIQSFLFVTKKNGCNGDVYGLMAVAMSIETAMSTQFFNLKN